MTVCARVLVLDLVRLLITSPLDCGTGGFPLLDDTALIEVVGLRPVLPAMMSILVVLLSLAAWHMKVCGLLPSAMAPLVPSRALIADPFALLRGCALEGIHNLRCLL